MMNAPVGINGLKFLRGRDKTLCAGIRHLLSERMVSLGIMGTQLRAPVEQLNTIEYFDSPRCLSGALNRALMILRDAGLSVSYTSDRCCSNSQAWNMMHL